ncbi:MAG: hypothetical protein HY238_17425 [Acidobacteria bacterium]|nr:hypothetical protein [Acidobacteriota bacterium]
MNLKAWGFTDPRSNKPDPNNKTPRERAVVFDLSRPLPDSGAKTLPTNKDSLGRFHAFWKHDHETETISFPLDIGPVGVLVDSDRIEMWLLVNGVQHVLTMGPWALGEFSARAAINGKGTTKARITRESEDSWRITAPKESIARLWDYSDIQNPVDKGLYYFDFDVKFTLSK